MTEPDPEMRREVERLSSLVDILVGLIPVYDRSLVWLAAQVTELHDKVENLNSRLRAVERATPWEKPKPKAGPPPRHSNVTSSYEWDLFVQGGFLEGPWTPGPDDDPEWRAADG